MRAFVVTGSGVGGVQEVEDPVPAAGQAVVEIALSGICGTDVSLFHGDAARLRHVRSDHPLRLGHEWSGTVTLVGSEVDAHWVGRRVTGDTMLGCGRCERCLSGLHHVCEDRYEIGVRRGWPGSLAEQLLVPVTALHRLPESVTFEMGALVEPGANAFRAVEATNTTAGSRVLVLGPGTIGLLCARFAIAAGSDVHVLGRTDSSLELARSLGVHGAWRLEDLPALRWDAVIDATDAPEMAAFAVNTVEPAHRVVFVGISDEPSLLDTRVLARRDVTAVGILGGSFGIDPAIASYAAGAVDPRPLISAVVGLEELPDALSGIRPPGAGPGPKILVDPSRIPTGLPHLAGQ